MYDIHSSQIVSKLQDTLVLDKIMVGVGQSVTMDTVQIMIFLVTLVLTYERTILRTTTGFFYFSYELFLCIIILNSVMEHSTVLLILSLSLY